MLNVEFEHYSLMFSNGRRCGAFDPFSMRNGPLLLWPGDGAAGDDP